MSQRKPDKSILLKRAVYRAYRLFRRALSDSRPRITLSKNLYFRVFPDHAVLVSLGIDNIIDFHLSLDALRAVLESIYSASSSCKIQKIRVEGLTVETDGRPKKLPLILFEGGLFDWLWSPNAVASSSKPSTDYVWIKVVELLSIVCVAIDRREVERAYGELRALGDKANLSQTTRARSDR
jgi:hypothetical protein